MGVGRILKCSIENTHIIGKLNMKPNEIELCQICNGKLIVSKCNPKYHICDECESQFVIDHKQSNPDAFYENIYLQDIDSERNTIILDMPHYDRIFTILKHNGLYEMLSESKINTCHCYGGGFPKLEVNLPVSNINVYDLIASIYRKNHSVFVDFYDDQDIEISYIDHDILHGIIKPLTPIFFTFVHILEHFSVSEMIKILTTVNAKMTSGSYGIIYQPNIQKAKHRNWVHYIADQHLTFLTLPMMNKILNSFSRIDVIHNFEISDDMFILFKIT